jgi:spore coat polysaccharide biosynthesis protein SpsF
LRQSTPQEAFWAGEFGSGYIDRNRSDELLASNLAFFEQALRSAGPISTCVEFGANVGMNMKALQSLYPGLDARGIEINGDAAEELRKVIGADNVVEGSMFDWTGDPAQLSFTKGVLIHINPDMLRAAYDRLYAASSQFILVAEYYNPAPVAIPYRGHQDRLFKRDFAGEMLELYPDLSLVDYGFVYRRDPKVPQDDITWFLLKRS